MDKNNSSESDSEHRPRAEELIDREILEKWRQEQTENRSKLQLYDTEPWQLSRKVYDKNQNETNFTRDQLRYIAGIQYYIYFMHILLRVIFSHV
jgi:hypothetical protein